MDKYDKYNPDEETIEAWLKGFEIRLLCNNITAAASKSNWCRSLVGKAGNSIIEKLPQSATWTEIKEELCSVLGESNPKKRAFEILCNYKPKGKNLGEMATDIMAKAAIATYDTDLQTQLGLKAFLQAVPRNIGRGLRRQHLDSVKEALDEARFLQSVEKDENCESGRIFAVETEPLEEGLKVEIKQIVKDCIKEMQAQQPKKEQSERPRSSRRKLWCWYCSEMGHLMKGCPVIQQDRTAPCKQKAEKRMPDGAKGCQMVSDGAKGCQMVPESAKECQNGPDGANGCQMVPEGGKGCQKDQIGPVVAPGLGKKCDLIFVTVTIAGVEVVAMVNTSCTTSACSWEWYQKRKDNLGSVIKSKVRVMGIAPDPTKIKGLTKPLTLHWDGVGDKFQLMVLSTLNNIDVVLGVDILSQFKVKFDWEKQVASPYREPCTPVTSTKNVGLLRDNPDSTFKGKIPVKEEGVKEVAKDMLRPAYQDIRYCYISQERKRNTKDKKEDRKIVRKSSMPWNQADYKAQLKKDLEDIRQKLCRVLGKELAKKEHSNMEATSPVNRIEEDVLVDLCEQRSDEMGSGCNAPEEIYKSPTLANVSCKSSEGFPTPVTSPLMPPKPARTGRKQYSWRNSSKKEACMYIRIFNPLEFRNETEMQRSDEKGSVLTPLRKFPEDLHHLMRHGNLQRVFAPL